MADVKAQLQRVVELAKKHPYIAGGLVLGVGVLGYLAYKNGGGEGGSDGEVSGGASIDQSGGTSPGLFDGGSIPSVTTPQEVFVTPDTSNIFSPPSAPSVNSGNSGKGSLFEDIFAPSASSVVPVYNPTPAFGMLPATAEILPSANVVKALPIPTMTPASWVAGSVDPVLGFRTPMMSGTPSDFAKPSPAKPSQNDYGLTRNPTDSQKVGKGRNFTGLLDGIYYVSGYISNAPAQKIFLNTPSSAAVSLPTIKAAAKKITAGGGGNKKPKEVRQ